jgi:FkbM family methyltransferase
MLPDEMKKVEPCSCPIAGWCERHKEKKDARLHRMCQEREDVRALLDSRQGKNPFRVVGHSSNRKSNALMGCGETRDCGKGVIPDALKMGWNAVTSIGHWMKNGRQTPTVEQAEERQRICENCPSGLLRKSFGKLKCAPPSEGGCGCFVALKAGIIADPGKSDCPKGHWPPIGAAEPLVDRNPRSAKIDNRKLPESGKVLISLKKGLGDSMCFRSVLMHLKQLRPELEVAVHCNPWHTSAFHGLVKNIVSVPKIHDHTVRHAVFLRPYHCFEHFPCNTTQHYLIECCNVTPNKELSVYGQLLISDAEMKSAETMLSGYAPRRDDGRFKIALIHQVGRSYPSAKNPRQDDWLKAIQHVKSLGYEVVAVTFDVNSEAAKLGLVHSLDIEKYRHEQHATSLAALIEQSSLFIGVDSGPLHVAGACSTPAIGVWTQHHPVHSYNLAANVTHLVPENHDKYLPTSNCRAGLNFFHQHYNHRIYRQLSDAMPLLAEELLCAGGDLVMHRDVWLRRQYVKEDWFIANEIFTQDDYRVKQLDWMPRTVIDVGAHCGFFSRQASQLWPEASIIAVEPVAENAAAARKNCPKAVVMTAACTYEPEPIRLHVTLGQQEHTGGSRIAADGERIVPRVTLDEILCNVGHDDVLLKLDCEGAEFSILENAKLLDKVRTIVGESHGHDKFVKLVRRKLPDWKLTVYRDHEIGLFRLDRP